MISNGEVASLLRTLAELMMLHGENDSASKSFSVAAFQMSGLTRNVVDMDKGELQKIFNSKVVSKIQEIKATSGIQMLDELIQLTPSGIFEMMRIKGLGGKKLAVLWKQAGIDHMDMLLKACRNNEVARIKGFGEKTQQNIIKAIDYYKSNAGRFHFATIEDEADKITEVIVAISLESRQKVDEMITKAMASGAKESNDTQDQGWMYSRSFQDPDGHLWEVIYMDPAGMNKD